MNIIGSFSSYSTDNLESCKKFYEQTLGLEISESMGGININFPGGQKVFVYPKEDHQAAKHTVINIVVDDINSAIDDLSSKGVKFERYEDLPAQQDDRGVLRGKDSGMGPNIAWFNDPSENIISLVEE